MTAFTVGPGSAETIAEVWRERWSGETIYTPYGTFAPDAVTVLAARDADGRLLGALAYALPGGEGVVVSINAFLDGIGVGTGLLEAMIAEVLDTGATTVRASLTNDNVRAYAFFQKRGFRLVRIRAGAIAEVREKKPSIPLYAPNGLPIRDYVDVELVL